MPEPSSIINNLSKILKSGSPHINLEPGDSFYWSPETLTVFFAPKALEDMSGIWSLLHEAGHGLLGHSNYESDLELIILETAAWEKAKDLASKFDITIDEEHIQDCLDTYRDWLHQRCTCPRCGSASLQHNPSEYYCHNCHAEWQVTKARFCRPYRTTTI
jgi:hypothetical protein